MATSSPGRRRAKISVTLDPALLNAVDLYVQSQPDLDRSKVMEAALHHWYRARQDDAMIEQFSVPEGVASEEQQSWRRIRRAAVSRRLKRPAR
ncbi:MAG: hypothetical protein M3Z28_07740 [Candidatus Dormibacteraeota bacterium]|nr:hypothetical protein [Candidatus Dormibacteraeota bacterium]